MSTRNQRNRVFIRNISFDAKENQIREAISKFGPITDLLFLQERGIAFVSFKDSKSYEACKKANEKISINGRPVMIKDALPAGESYTQYSDHEYYSEYDIIEEFDAPPSKQKAKDTIFISNLPAEIEDFEIREIFLKYKPYQLKTDFPEGQNVQFAFIQILDPALMNKAIKEMNGIKIKGKVISVSNAKSPFQYSSL